MRRSVVIPLFVFIIYNFTIASTDWNLRIPNGDYVYKAGKTSCQICHEYAAPTTTSVNLNAFGLDFLSAGNNWSQSLAQKDSDGDGFTNESELSCHNYSWIPSMGVCGSDLGNVFNPGDPTVKPGISIETMSLSQSGAPRLYAAPNPFNPVTTLRFTAIPSAFTSGKILILSADGRTVRTLKMSSAEMAAGQRMWDGRDERGVRAATGLYTAVLSAPGMRLSARLTLLR